MLKETKTSLYLIVQALVIGAPIFRLIEDWPQIFVPVISVMIFIVCMATLLLIFLPKIHHEKKRRKISNQARDQTNTRLSVIRHRTGQETKSTRLMRFVNLSLKEPKVGKNEQEASPNVEVIEEECTGNHDHSNNSEENSLVQLEEFDSFFSAQESVDGEEVGLAFTVSKGTPSEMNLGLSLSPSDEGKMKSVKNRKNKNRTFVYE